MLNISRSKVFGKFVLIVNHKNTNQTWMTSFMNSPFIRPILQTSLACRPSERGRRTGGRYKGKRISYLQVTELEGR